MDIQEIQERFEGLMLANPDFDESLLVKDDEGCYEDFDIDAMYQMFEAGLEVGEKLQAAKAQVPEGFVLVPIKPTEKTLQAIFDNKNSTANAYKAIIKAQEQSHE